MGENRDIAWRPVFALRFVTVLTRFAHVCACFRSEFLDVSQSAMDYHDEEPDDGGLGAKLRGITVQPERMEFSGLPRPSAKNQDTVIPLLSSNGLPQTRLATLESAANAILAAVEGVKVNDKGKPVVVHFPPAA